jgi:hypothetical protein
MSAKDTRVSLAWLLLMGAVSHTQAHTHRDALDAAQSLLHLGHRDLAVLVLIEHAEDLLQRRTLLLKAAHQLPRPHHTHSTAQRPFSVLTRSLSTVCGGDVGG